MSLQLSLWNKIYSGIYFNVLEELLYDDLNVIEQSLFV